MPSQLEMTKNIINPELDKGLSTKQQNKKNKLISFFESVYHSPYYNEEFALIENALNLNRTDVLNEFLNYNMDIFQPIGNSIYQSIANRVVLHLHNLLQGSWHIERQDCINELVAFSGANTIADIGFGVPSQYIKKLIISKQTYSLSLCDLYTSAFKFAGVLLSSWCSGWESQIKFIETDMDKNDYVGDFDLYIFQDSIEHTLQPTEYLTAYVEKSSKSSRFLISLPIGPIFPRHYIAWETHDEAKEWLRQCGLSVVKSETVYVNPEVDLFAEQLTDTYCNYIVLCEKY